MKKAIIILAYIMYSINAMGQNFQWAKSMGGISEDEGYSIAVDIFGNVYTTGYFNYTVDFDPGAGVANLTSAGNTEIFISKLNASGNFVWAKRLGGIDANYGHSIVVDNSGYVYITGSFRGVVDFDPSTKVFNLSSAGGHDIFISKLDSSGNFVWVKSIGGSDDDMGYSIKLDGFGNLYTTGQFSSTVDFDPGVGTSKLTSTGQYYNDIFILKLDTFGNFIWVRGMTGPGNDRGYSLTIDDFENVYTSGIFNGKVDFDPDTSTFNLTSAGKQDVFISKLNTSGNFIWAKNMGGIEHDDCNSIAVDSFGNVYTTGSFQGTSDFDPNIGTFNLASKGSYDIFISKLDSSGNFVWAKSMGGASFDFGESISVDEAGDIYTTGSFGATANFNPNAVAFNMTSVGGYDMYISKHDASGNFLWAKGIGSVDNDYGSSITFDKTGSIYSSGYFSGYTDFDPDAGTFNLSSVGSRDIFILKLQKTSLGSREKLNKNLISIFPNPVNKQINIKVDAILIGSSYSIYNQVGSNLVSGKLNSMESSIDLSAISAGIYLFVVGDNVKQTYKMIKL